MKIQLNNSVAIIFSVIVFSCFSSIQSRAPYPRFPYGPQNNFVLPVMQNSRPQRSIYGPVGWNGGGVGSVAFSPVGLGHITKDELLALLEAWKEVESAAEKAEPEPEPVPDPEPEPQPEAKPESAKPARPAGPEARGPPPGVPLTVSLPAFVPIQLSAMYTAPAPGRGAGEGAPEGPEADPEPAEPEGPPPPPPEPAPVAVPLRNVQHTILKIWTTQPQQLGSMAAIVGVPKKAASQNIAARPKAVKQRTFASTYFVAPAPRNFGPPPPIGGGTRIFSAPPPFLSHAPGPLKFVPSSHLLSNWR